MWIHLGEKILPYLEQLCRQWKAYLFERITATDFVYLETKDGDFFDIKANSLVYFSWAADGPLKPMWFDESRDRYSLEACREAVKRTRRKKAERAPLILVSKLQS